MIYRFALVLGVVALINPAAAAFAESKASGKAGDGEVPMLGIPTMLDTAPVLADEDLTLPGLERPPEGESVAAANSHGGSDDEGAPPSAAELSTAEHDPAAAHCVRQIGDTDAPAATDEADPPCLDMVDATAMVVGPDGTLQPVGEAAGSTAALVGEKLQERRLELEGRADEVEAKQAILDAAEQRLLERTAALEAIELKIEAAAVADAGVPADTLKDMIAVYEGMKPAAAAQIFDELPGEVLVRLAKEMNPRKMAPILAKMQPERAGQLTILLAGRP